MPFCKTSNGDYYLTQPVTKLNTFVVTENRKLRFYRCPAELVGKRVRLKLEVVK